MAEIYIKLRDGGTIFRDPNTNIKVTANVVVKTVRSKRVNEALKGGALLAATEQEYKEYILKNPPKAPAKSYGKAAVKAAPAEAPAPEPPTGPPAGPPQGGTDGGGKLPPDPDAGGDKDKKPSGK